MKYNKICKYCCYFQPDYNDEGECCVDVVTEPTNAYTRACKSFTTDEEESNYNTDILTSLENEDEEEDEW